MAKTDPVEQETKAAPIPVGNPAAAASLAIEQSHMEEFANAEEKSPGVRFGRPPKGIHFTVRAETTKPWKDRAFYFLLDEKLLSLVTERRGSTSVRRPIYRVSSWVTMFTSFFWRM